MPNSVRLYIDDERLRNYASPTVPSASTALALKPVMRVETAPADRQYYHVFYLQGLAQPRAKWVACLRLHAAVFIVLKTITRALRTDRWP